MLSDEEFKEVAKHSGTFVEELRAQQIATGLDRQALFATGWLPKILIEYKRLSGTNETNINVIWHHKMSIYGPPCLHCGTVLRTPQARFCFLCHRYQSEGEGLNMGHPNTT